MFLLLLCYISVYFFKSELLLLCNSYYYYINLPCQSLLYVYVVAFVQTSAQARAIAKAEDYEGGHKLVSDLQIPLETATDVLKMPDGIAVREALLIAKSST